MINVIALASLAFKSVLTLSIGGWRMARHAIAGRVPWLWVGWRPGL